MSRECSESRATNITSDSPGREYERMNSYSPVSISFFLDAVGDLARDFLGGRARPEGAHHHHLEGEGRILGLAQALVRPDADQRQHDHRERTRRPVAQRPGGEVEALMVDSVPDPAWRRARRRVHGSTGRLSRSIGATFWPSRSRCAPAATTQSSARVPAAPARVLAEGAESAPGASCTLRGLRIDHPHRRSRRWLRAQRRQRQAQRRPLAVPAVDARALAEFDRLRPRTEGYARRVGAGLRIGGRRDLADRARQALARARPQFHQHRLADAKSRITRSRARDRDFALAVGGQHEHGLAGGDHLAGFGQALAITPSRGARSTE